MKLTDEKLDYPDARMPKLCPNAWIPPALVEKMRAEKAAAEQEQANDASKIQRW